MSDGETEVSATAEWAKHRELLKRVTDNETSINRLDKALETICDKDIKEIGEKAERAMSRSRGFGLHLDLKPYTGNSNDLVFSEFLDRFDRLAANLPEDEKRNLLPAYLEGWALECYRSAPDPTKQSYFLLTQFLKEQLVGQGSAATNALRFNIMRREPGESVQGIWRA